MAGGRERRQFPRVALDAHVRIRLPSTDAQWESRIRDLSENGVFIVTLETRPIGTGLELLIELSDGPGRVAVRGIIVHEVRAEDATEDRPAGIGVMFSDLSKEAEAGIHAMMKRGEPI